MQAVLLQLVNEVLRRTGQSEIFTLLLAPAPAPQVVDFINETYFEMLQRLKVNRLQKQSTLATVDGVSHYNIAADTEINALLGDSLIETTHAQRLIEVDYTYPLTRGLNASGRPTAFYRQGDMLVLYPTPDAVYTIRYDYWVKPTALSDDMDTTQLPEDWEKVLILGSQARLEKFLGDAPEQTYALYRDNLLQLKARAAAKPHPRMKGFYRGSPNP